MTMTPLEQSALLSISDAHRALGPCELVRRWTRSIGVLLEQGLNFINCRGEPFPPRRIEFSS